MQPVNVRNLDDIQEEDRGSRTSRFAALLLASLAGAAIVTAAVVMSRRGGAVQHAPHAGGHPAQGAHVEAGIFVRRQR